jgi:light-harvesting protein B-800-850 alpha chain
MNQARLWLVVKPGVGIPLLLGSVALTSLIVHGAVLSHTTWYPAYLNGNQHTKAAALNTSAPLPPALSSGQAQVALR